MSHALMETERQKAKEDAAKMNERREYLVGRILSGSIGTMTAMTNNRDMAKFAVDLANEIIRHLDDSRTRPKL